MDFILGLSSELVYGAKVGLYAFAAIQCLQNVVSRHAVLKTMLALLDYLSLRHSW